MSLGGEPDVAKLAESFAVLRFCGSFEIVNRLESLCDFRA